MTITRDRSAFEIQIARAWEAAERFVMDIGFGAIIDHVREYYGPRAAKLTTGAIVALLFLGLLIALREGVIEPLYELVGGGDQQRKIATIALIAFGAGFSIALGFLISVALSHWARARRFMRETRKTTANLKEVALAVAETQDRSMEILRHSAAMAMEGTKRTRDAIEANEHMSAEEKAAHLTELTMADDRLRTTQAAMEFESHERDEALRRLASPDGAGGRP